MVDFGWFRGRGHDVASLVARKSYARAAALLRRELEADPGNHSLRQQLADVLALDGRVDEAIPIFEALADEYARAGFAAKAIATLKKIQRVAPGRQEIEEKLARLVHDREAEEVQRTTLRQLAEEMGREFPADELAAATALANPRGEEPGPSAGYDAEGDLVIDYGDPGAFLVPEPFPEAAPAGTEPPPVSPEAAGNRRRAGNGAAVVGIAKTPLFSDFTHDELLAVIRGLELLTFEAGDVIVTEGEPGGSLFVISSGSCKAFARDPKGRNHRLRTMREGTFFGEISVLQGGPRTATVVAAGPCELLELDAPTLARIEEVHPRVRLVLTSFAQARTNNPSDAMIRLGIGP